jgi:hypothetical protein|nr:MAG TPA: hypothetical protein [Caudoviricetes sp.]
MKLNDVLFKGFEKDVYLFDVDNNIIAHGEATKLFDMLGCYFLDLEVTRINDCNITVNIKLGGDE